jgi:hypothetical protein
MPPPPRGTWNLTTTDGDLPEDVPSIQLSGNAGAYFGVPALFGRATIPSDAPDGQDPQSVVRRTIYNRES